MTKKKKKKGGTARDHAPCVTPLPDRRFSPWQTVSIITRNAVPLIGVLFFSHSAGNFVLLCVFNLALTIACIVVVGVAVSLHGNTVSAADRIASLGVLLLVGIGVTVVLTVLFGWAVAVFVAHSEHSLLNRSLLWGALSIVLCALPELWHQYDDDVRSKQSETQRKQRDQPVIFIHVLSAGLIFSFCPYAFEFGRTGMIVAAIAITALFVFRDLHPDLMRRLAPTSGSG